jgi:Leucine-rich repeat (LRR) protein
MIESRESSPEPENEDEISEEAANDPLPIEAEIEAPQELESPSIAEPEKSKGGLKAPRQSTNRSKSPKSRPSLGPAFAPNTSDGKAAGEPQRAISSSSTALRQQIAAAKAAARKEKLKHDSPQDSTANAGASFDIQMHTNPFNEAPRNEKHILRNRINIARVDGKLNIAAMGLRKIPDEVLKMYDAKAMEECNVNWAEVVDLTRLIAADNELDELDDTVFPDRSPHDVDADGCAEGNQFGGLEMIDLHGNLLSSIPTGLRRLERLTSLNLAHNKLDNAAFDVLSEMQSLKDLKLGNNSLSGNLPTSICALPHLETLDLQSNRLLGLPEAMRELVNLKFVNISGNQLTTLPMDALEGLPLIELDASSNLLIASLFPLGGANGHPSLQVMNVANNSLAALTFLESLHLPRLRSLNVSNNHLTVLPSVAGWTDLVTLAVGDNKIAQFPEGFTKLQKLRIVNFASNELRLVDPEVTRMSSLETLILAANPLREKKFLSMSAGDIKRELRARMTPSENGDGDDAIPESPVTVIGAGDNMDDGSTPASTWQMKSNGVLELIAKNLADDVNDILAAYFQANEVRDLVLHSNKLTCIPPAINFGQDLRSLDFTDNPFSGDDYLYDVLELPFLQELSLSKCRLTSLDPLLSQLRAPHLRSLNVCANRLTGAVPLLRDTYPKLSTFLASDNRFEAVTAEAVRGLANVNLASNNIAQLPAELGLLWDEGLRHLDVGSNSFRVPNYRILERGTEATLRWLRNKLPANAGQVTEVD